MTKILITAMLVASAAVAIAQDQAPVISSELTVLPAATVLQRDRVALLGGYAVLTKTAASAYALEQTPSGDQLLVVQDPLNGRLGTTDGGLVVVVYSLTSLDGLAADYGLRIKHVFGAQPVVILVPRDREAADTYVARLESDDRVVSAELNVNFYQEQAY